MTWLAWASIERNAGQDVNRRIIKMAVVEELIRTENNETLSFGNYNLAKKSKADRLPN